MSGGATIHPIQVMCAVRTSSSCVFFLGKSSRVLNLPVFPKKPMV